MSGVEIGLAMLSLLSAYAGSFIGEMLIDRYAG